ncbi:MAG: DUF4234 domain-containing protein [Planctomycetes bacterium]|nr:DUF4234 domain-containing protein [Planctomycetota bacterium]
MKCPFCLESIAPESTVCKFCRSELARKCPFCAETVAAEAKKCKFCHSDLSSPAGGPPRAARLSPHPVGEERDILKTILFTLLTFGIYGWIFFFRMAGDINRHSGRERVNPVLDLVLVLVTCGLWWLAVCYRYARAVYEMEVEEGCPTQDQSGICLLVGFLLGVFALLIVQDQLNKHWRLHRA